MKPSSPAAWLVLFAAGPAVLSCGVHLEIGTNYDDDAPAGPAAGQSSTGSLGGATGGAGSGSSEAGGSTAGGSAGIVASAGRGSAAGGQAAGGSGGASYGGGSAYAGSGAEAGGESGLGPEAPLAFTAPKRYPGGGWAMDIGVADLNGDGALDVASADFTNVDAGAFVWLNQGDGTFGAASPYLPGKQATSIAIGDFDGDAKPELILASEDELSMLRNNGDGTFSAPSPLSAPGSAVRALDANGDTKLDFLAGSSLFLNQGNGVFGASASVAIGSPRVATDLNGDDRIDLVGGGGSVFVSLNTGDGAFAPRTAYTTRTSAEGSTVRGPAVGDVNHDGWPDIAAANDRQASASVLLNKGDGTFSVVHDYPTGSWPTAVALGDLNGDEWPELVVANSDIGTSITEGPRYVGVYRNRGDGTFETPEEFILVEFGYALAIADLNGDHKLDIVVGDGGGGLNVALNMAP